MTTPKKLHELKRSRRIPLLDRLMMRISVSESGCWNWTGKIRWDGYGSFKVTDKKYGMTHRMLYEEVLGKIPEGLVLDHLCRNKRCANPSHLEPVTQAVNIRRGNNLMRGATHCKRGHELSGDNLIPGIARICRSCVKLRADRRKQEIRNGATPRTKGGRWCVNGHEYLPETTLLDKDGSRRCGICVKAAAARMRAKYKAQRMLEKSQNG